MEREMADGIRKMARALYDRGGEGEKREAERFFDALDSNEDGKVSLREFQKSKVVGYPLSNDGVFKALRSNADGTMSFDDVLVLFYIKKGAHTIFTCHECDELISGPSFPSNSGSICCLCYGQGNSIHWTQSAQMPANLSLVKDTKPVTNEKVIHIFPPSNSGSIYCLCYGRGNSIHWPRSVQMPANLSVVKYTMPVTNEKEGMKELRKIAELHCFADEFFESMYRDRHGKVKIEDFQSVMLQKGYKQLQNPRLFDDLGASRTGTLGFSEVMTLYYIIKSGRPHCDRCKVFIPGVFFTCVRCFNYNKGRSFNLCSKCYEAGDGNYHVHKKGTQFLDNYTLLHTLRESSSLPRRQNRDPDDQRDKPSSPTPTVPSTQNSRIGLIDLAYKGLELGIAICNAFAARRAT